MSTLEQDLQAYRAAPARERMALLRAPHASAEFLLAVCFDPVESYDAQLALAHASFDRAVALAGAIERIEQQGDERAACSMLSVSDQDDAERILRASAVSETPKLHARCCDALLRRDEQAELGADLWEAIFAAPLPARVQEQVAGNSHLPIAYALQLCSTVDAEGRRRALENAPIRMLTMLVATTTSPEVARYATGALAARIGATKAAVQYVFHGRWRHPRREEEIPAADYEQLQLLAVEQVLGLDLNLQYAWERVARVASPSALVVLVQRIDEWRRLAPAELVGDAWRDTARVIADRNDPLPEVVLRTLVGWEMPDVCERIAARDDCDPATRSAALAYAQATITIDLSRRELDLLVAHLPSWPDAERQLGERLQAALEQLAVPDRTAASPARESMAAPGIAQLLELD
jgi:hypothetical protein